MPDINAILQGLFEQGNQYLKVQVARTKRYPKGFVYRLEKHERIEINYVHKGSCTMQFDDDVVAFKEGDYMIIYPGISHKFLVEGMGCTLIQLEFTIDGKAHIKEEVSTEEQSFLQEVLSHSRKFLRFRNNESLRHCITRIIEELKSTAPDKEVLVKVYFSELFILLTRQIRKTLAILNQPNLYVKDALAAIHRNYDQESLDLSQVAAETNVSDRYLRKVFKQEIGMSPVDYITLLRINKAKQEIRNLGQTFSEVAYKVGYSSPQYFSKMFLKKTGLTPSQFRKTLYA